MAFTITAPFVGLPLIAGVDAGQTTANSATDTATVSWINATTGATPTSFNIQCASNTTFTGTSLKTATATATASSATVTGIVRSTAGTNTYCRVQAVNNGVPSPWSSASTAVLAK